MSKIANSTFKICEPSWANACVGDNGSPDYEEYFKGFSKASLIIADALIADNDSSLTLIDELIYPICFNMRHSIELRIKYATQEIKRLYEIKDKSYDKKIQSIHDIKNLWAKFSEMAQTIDRRRFESLINKIDPYVNDIAEVDLTGQVFRYPRDIDEGKHLTEISAINIIHLKKVFKEIENHFDELHNLIKLLINEFECGTFTKNLSRNDIEIIASLLPHKDYWKDENFCEMKSYIKDEYKISNNELSKAIDIIQNHIQFSSLIGINIKPPGVNKEVLEKFLIGWHDFHDNSPNTPKEFLEKYPSLSNTWNILRPILSAEDLAGLQALFDFKCDSSKNNYSEYYIEVYNSKLNETKNLFDDDGSRIRDDLFDLLHNKNYLKNLRFSLIALKQTEIAQALRLI